MKIAVLGAGVSGLSAARLLKEAGSQVTVYEKMDVPGGLAQARYIEGNLYEPYGGHIFNSKHKEVVDWVFSILPIENWHHVYRNAKIFYNGKFVSYPFEYALNELNTDDAVDCVYDFMMAQQGPEPDTYGEWLVWNFGNGIADRYLTPYNQKIWKYSLDKMGTGWMRGKMPLPSKKEILKSVISADASERNTVHSSFYYPRVGGIKTFIDAMAKDLDIKCSYEIHSIKKDQAGKWSINGEGEYDLIISTIPLPELPPVMELPERVVGHIEDLKFNSLVTGLFVGKQTDMTWLYVPSLDYPPHRINYAGNYALDGNGDPDTVSAAIEITCHSPEDVSDEVLFSPKCVPDELGLKRVITRDYHKYAYVIHDINYQSNVDFIRDYFKKDQSFRLLGRWGYWNYNNMDLCMLDAMKLVKEITN